MEGGNSASGSVPKKKVDVRFSVGGGDLQKMFYGLLKPRTAYMNGTLQVDGDLQTALKLDVLIQKMQSMGASS